MSTERFKLFTSQGGDTIFLVDTILGTAIKSTSPTPNSTSGSLLVEGGIGISGTSNAMSITEGGSLTVAGGASIEKDLYVGGNIISSSLGGSGATFASLTITSTAAAINYTTGSIITDGGITINTTSNAMSVTEGGGLLVQGGASFGKDVYIGGDLYINGTNQSVFRGNVTIGNHDASSGGTGAYTLANVLIGSTMSNTNYRLVGSLRTTTDIERVYAHTFKNLTDISFDLSVFNISELGSGWTDANLILSWILYQDN